MLNEKAKILSNNMPTKKTSFTGNAGRIMCGSGSQPTALGTQASSTQNSNQKKEVVLSEEELKNFGNRCPSGYKKVKLLGK